MPRPIPILAMLALLAGCAAEPLAEVTRRLGPPDPRPGACYARGITPAVLETVTRQVQEAPAMRPPDGTVLRAARFRTETATRVVEPRGENWFETPCALRDGDPDFVRQVQRALAARGYYAGEINGFYDVPTRAAVQAFQDERGLESGTLSSDSARFLGLVALGREG